MAQATEITLTKLQREEVGHLRDVAQDEVDSGLSAHDPSDLRQWQADLDAYSALLDGQPLTPDQVYRLRKELEQHADKFAPTRKGGATFPDGLPGDRSTHTSITSLIRKLGG